MARIVVADDTAEIRQLIGAILADDGHDVRLAHDGGSAISMMQQSSPDLLILDIMMPVMDGYEVLRKMGALGLRETTKVLVLTAKTSESDWVRGYKLGADQYLAKPFEMDELTDAVEAVLSSTKTALVAHREKELHKAQLLSRLESLFEGS